MNKSKTSPRKIHKKYILNQKLNRQRSRNIPIVPENSPVATIRVACTPSKRIRTKNFDSFLDSSNKHNHVYCLTLDFVQEKQKEQLYLSRIGSNYHEAMISSNNKEYFSSVKLPKKIEKNSIIELYSKNGFTTKAIVTNCQFSPSTDVEPGTSRPKKGGKGH